MFRICFFGLVFVNTSRVENYKFKTRAYPIYFVVSIVARKRNIEMKNRMIQTSTPKHCQQKGTIVISHQHVQTLSPSRDDGDETKRHYSTLPCGAGSTRKASVLCTAATPQHPTPRLGFPWRPRRRARACGPDTGAPMAARGKKLINDPNGTTPPLPSRSRGILGLLRRPSRNPGEPDGFWLLRRRCGDAVHWGLSRDVPRAAGPGRVPRGEATRLNSKRRPPLRHPIILWLLRLILRSGVQIKVVLRSDVAVGTYDKVAVICGNHAHLGTFMCVNFTFGLRPMIRLGFGGNRG